MPHSLPLKASLKRGALIAAANWPLVAVQFVAEGTLKLLLGVPVVGGIFLVVLLLGADVEDVLARRRPRDHRHGVRRAARRTRSRSSASRRRSCIVLLGGSALTFVVKGGTVASSPQRRRRPAPIERPPLRLERRAPRQHRVHIEPFLDGCRRFWRRYVQLGACLLIAYARHRRRCISASSSAATRSPATPACCSAGRWSRRWRRACWSSGSR